MSTNLPIEQWQSILEVVMQKAASDERFRTQCLHTPILAINEATGASLPADMPIRFSETPVESSSELIILLPALGDCSLSEEDLDAVTGGVDSGMQQTLAKAYASLEKAEKTRRELQEKYGKW